MSADLGQRMEKLEEGGLIRQMFLPGDGEAEGQIRKGNGEASFAWVFPCGEITDDPAAQGVQLIHVRFLEGAVQRDLEAQIQPGGIRQRKNIGDIFDGRILIGLFKKGMGRAVENLYGQVQRRKGSYK